MIIKYEKPVQKDGSEVQTENDMWERITDFADRFAPGAQQEVPRDTIIFKDSWKQYNQATREDRGTGNRHDRSRQQRRANENKFKAKQENKSSPSLRNKKVFTQNTS